MSLNACNELDVTAEGPELSLGGELSKFTWRDVAV